MNGDPRYADINNTNYPAITRVEAAKAMNDILWRFGRRGLGSVNQIKDAVWNRPVRRCWISPRSTTGVTKGWGRLIHDLGHVVFRARHPLSRAHDGGHAALEREILLYCHGRQWLDGALAPKVKPKPTTLQRREKRLTEIEAGIKRWGTKAKRAKTAMAKLAAERTRVNRAILKDALE